MVLITPSDKKESLSRQSDDASAVGSLFRRVRTRRIQDNRRRKKGVNPSGVITRR